MRVSLPLLLVVILAAGTSFGCRIEPEKSVQPEVLPPTSSSPTKPEAEIRAIRAHPAGPVPEGVGREGRELLRVGPELVAVEIAAVPESRAQGLGGRTSLEEDEGMLFIYPDAQSRSFWMKGCLMALDIAYLDDGGRIFQIGTREPPVPGSDVMPRLRSEKPARFVLEMRAGWFRDHGIGPGTEVAFSASTDEWVRLVVEAEGR